MDTIGKVLRAITGWKSIDFVADHDEVTVLDRVAAWTDDGGQRRELGELTHAQAEALDAYYARILGGVS